MFILGDMGLEYGNEKRVCTPFDVVLAFFVSVLIVLKFVGEYGNKVEKKRTIRRRIKKEEANMGMQMMM